jgi:hypothetical protein
MTPEELRKRCRRFADVVIDFCVPLLDRPKARDIAAFEGDSTTAR